MTCESCKWNSNLRRDSAQFSFHLSSGCRNRTSRKPETNFAVAYWTQSKVRILNLGCVELAAKNDAMRWQNEQCEHVQIRNRHKNRPSHAHPGEFVLGIGNRCFVCFTGMCRGACTDQNTANTDNAFCLYRRYSGNNFGKYGTKVHAYI